MYIDLNNPTERYYLLISNNLLITRGVNWLVWLVLKGFFSYTIDVAFLNMRTPIALLDQFSGNTV